MGAIAIPSIVSDEDRQSLVRVFLEKMNNACYVDLIVGTALLVFYGAAVYNGTPVDKVNLWPLVASLGITRAGDTLKTAAYWVYHKAGELNAQTS